MKRKINEEEYEEYLQLLAENGLSEEEDEAMTSIMHDHDFDGWR